MSGRPVQIAVLYARLSGYVVACLRRLKAEYDVELLVVRVPPSFEAPFEARHFEWIDRLYDRPALTDEDLWAHLEAFAPDAVLMSGWFDRGYLKAARRLRRHGVPVIAGTDAQWHGTLRQQFGVLAASRLLHPAIDVLWVTGERQRQFAYRLGYRGPRCWSGCYACDWDRFAAAYATREAPTAPHFLYVGRYVDVKGLDVLVDAYRQYRAAAPEPWPLRCAGTGSDAARLQGVPGIEDLGFVQPDRLPSIMQAAAGFILPSRREPWGVVLQEAAAAGLPLLSSDASGAAVHLLRDGYNGFLFESGNAEHLASQMLRLHGLAPTEQVRMGARSHDLSRQYTPALWASTLMEGLRTLRA